ncbi:MAG: energy transducer TonB [Blastocatellia bacterium]|nr:energy transducer TonB [Blastocatellia bacterium]
MKVCPKCAQSFADGFRYCPKDAHELVKYDLRARIQRPRELQFLVKNNSLFARLRDEITDAANEIKRNPGGYINSMLRGEGSTRRRRRLLQAGLATALITYTSIILLVILVGLSKAPITGTKADPLHPDDDLRGPVRLLLENVKPAETAKAGRGLLGGSLKQPRRAGGGGGANDNAPVSKGKMPTPTFAPQINLPEVPKSTRPILVVPETVVVDPIFMHKLKGPTGTEDGQLEAPSRGDRGGTGVGEGTGPGFKNGNRGNFGNGPNKIGGGDPNGPDSGGALPYGKPTLLYTEKARYTEEARRNKIQGTVVLSVVFGADGLIHDIRTIHGLPDGLTETAIEAAKRIRFQPAVRSGKPVSVRTNLEFNFALF